MTGRGRARSRVESAYFGISVDPQGAPGPKCVVICPAIFLDGRLPNLI